MKRRVVIITWVSWSWKTTLQNELLNKGWKRPINFTTRKPRSEKELDEYIFLDENQFLKKLKNWDFLEFTQYNWNFYWVSAYLPEWDIAIVLDPVWRSMVSEYFSRKWIEYELYYLDINSDIQRERLEKRWDSVEDIKKRANDLKWFSPTNHCTILDWRTSPTILANLIDNVNI